MPSSRTGSSSKVLYTVERLTLFNATAFFLGALGYHGLLRYHGLFRYYGTKFHTALFVEISSIQQLQILLFRGKCSYFAAKMSLQINETFLSLRDFKEGLRNWAIIDHFEYRWLFSDSQRAKAVCVYKGCLFAVRCNWYEVKKIARVTGIISNHNCTGNPVVKRSQASRVDWILGALPTVLTVGPTTTSLAIIEAIKLHYRHLVPKQQAQRARRAILNATNEELVADYTRVPAYLRALHEVGT